MRILKIAAIVLSGIMLLLAAAAAYLAATFDPNAYKPQIEQLAKDKLGRTLKIGGPIKLTFYPTLGAALDGLTLSETNKDKEFAAVESVRVALQFVPLLSKQLVVSQVEVRGLRANVIKHKDGTTNIDDLVGKDKNPSASVPAGSGDSAKPMQFDIAHVLVENASATYADEATGAKYAIGKLGVKTGRIAAGKPSELEIVAQGITATKPRASLDAKLKTRVSADPASGRFRLDDLDLGVKGEAAGLKPLALDLKGVLEGDAKTVTSPGLSLDLDARQGERTIKAKLTTPVTVDLATTKVDLAKLVASVNLADAKSPGKPLALSLTGAAHADVPKQTATLDFVTKFDESNINGKAGLAKFDPPSYVFDVNIDKLDLERYASQAPATASAPAGEAKAAPATPEQPIDLSALKTLNARGSAKIGALRAAKLNLQNVRVDLKAGGGRLDLAPIAASLYQGTLNGTVSVVAAATPQVAMKQTLSGISIGPLLKDAIDKDMLEGKGNVTLDVSGQGATASAIKKALGGTAALDLSNGALKGINIGAELRNAREKLDLLRGKPSVAQAASATERTDFTELKASFAIRNGIAHNSDLSMKSPLLRLGGEGDINLGADSIDYLAKATLVATSTGQGGKDVSAVKGLMVPVRITGPFTALKYQLDFNAMATGLAQQKIEEKKEEVKAKVQDKIKDQLKGLFGRGR